MLARAKSKIGFISGPLEATQEYFATHYIPLLDRGISLNHSFVLGAARGIDSMALEYLLLSTPPRYPAKQVTLYLSHTEASRLRPRYSWFERIGGNVKVAGQNHTQRDETMTRASHYDILRYRTEEECRVLYGIKYRVRISGTEKNEQRRMQGLGLVWREAVNEDGRLDSPGLVAVVAKPELPNTSPISAGDKKRQNLERKVREAAKLKECIARGDILEANQIAKAEKHEIWLKELVDLEAVKNQS